MMSCGTIMAKVCRDALENLSLGWLIAVYGTINLSGGHLNPAITLAVLLTGHFNVLTGVAYIIAQVQSSL